MIKHVAPVILLLSACAQLPVQAPSPLMPVTDDTCGSAQYATLIGRDATALERVLLMGPVRVIRPGMAVTTDYSASRINFAIDAGNRITGITCG